MSELDIPESWTHIRLEDLCDRIQYGATASAKDKGPCKFLRITDITDTGVAWESVPHCDLSTKDVAKYLLCAGDVVIARTGGTVGKSYQVSWIPNEPIAFASYLIRLSLCTPLRSGSYVPLFLKSPYYWRFISDSARGAAQPNVNAKILGGIEIPLPPLAEQHRIVTKIESTFKRIEAIEKAVESAESLLTKYRESLLNKAFRGELVPQDPKDEPASKLLERIRAERAKQQDGKKKKKDDLPPITEDEIPFEIPESWEWVRLGEIVKSIDAGWSPQCESRPRSGDEWGVLKISAVTWGRYQPEENKALPSRLKPRPEHEVSHGDFIISRANTAELVGRGVVIEVCPPKLLLNDKLLRIKFWNGASTNYFNLINNGKIGRSYYASVASGTSSSMRNITREQIKLMVVPLPPSGEQERIVTSIKKLEKEISSLRSLLLKFEELRLSIGNSTLSAAFSGRLVPQAPSEGTGYQLLEQILSTKANAESSKPVKSPTKQRRTKK